MFSFKQYLTEEKNTHLEHLEDDIINYGAVGGRNAVNFLKSIRDMLVGNSSGKVNVSVKWDGAPAIFCGTNPENGKFFVGTKSVFNVTPKINYTNRASLYYYNSKEEIDLFTNHLNQVIGILKK